MRIIEVSDAPIRSMEVSPDGRFVAASADRAYGLFDWFTGEPVFRLHTSSPVAQFAFAPDGRWVACGWTDQPLTLIELAPDYLHTSLLSPHAGGVAVSPDGKKLVATQGTGAISARLAAWELPALRPRSGFGDWPSFRRLAFSRNGEFVAGTWERGFELRFARTDGIDYRSQPYRNRPFSTPGFVSFTHDSGMCAFGWDSEIHVLDLSSGTGKVIREPAPERRGEPPLRSSDREKDATWEYRAPYHAAAFTGSGRYLATIEQPDRWKRWNTNAQVWNVYATADRVCVLKMWDVGTWQVVREYDWQCGPLTCLAFTADGSAGVCGTADGRLVQFDVDE